MQAISVGEVALWAWTPAALRNSTGLCFVLAALLVGGFARADIEVVCHRGANEVAPENTRAAAQKCIDWGCEYVEIDVRTSKDGVLYILHDPTVNRTTNGKGLLRSLTSDQIDQLDAGSWFCKRFAGEKVPRLKPYLQWIKGKIKVYFDVKDADLKQLIALVYELGMQDQCFFFFNNPARALEFRKLDQKLPLKVNVGSVEQVRKARSGYGANIVEVTLRNISKEIVAACHQEGLKVMIYEPRSGTQVDRERVHTAYRQIVEWKPDMVNLDFGDLFKTVERQSRPR